MNEQIIKIPWKHTWVNKRDGYQYVSFNKTETGRILRSHLTLGILGVLNVPVGPDVIVHHEDRCKTNDNPLNLEVKVRGPHTAEHNTGRVVSPESRQKQSLSRTGVTSVCSRCGLQHATAKSHGKPWHGFWSKRNWEKLGKPI